MQLEQAIFTSSQRSRIKGYQLVCRSAGIDRNMAQELSRWSPSQLPDSADQNDWFLSFYSLSHGFKAIARTVWGGPEYSCRGGNRVVTLICLTSTQQLAAYQNDPGLVASTALSLGHLRMPLDIPRSLETMTLPDAPIRGCSDTNSFNLTNASRTGVVPDSTPSWAPNLGAGDLRSASPNASLLIETAELVNARKRVALVGVEQPLEFLRELLPQLGGEIRAGLSFTTGLQPSSQRPFQVHFVSDVDMRLQASLDGQGIRLLHANMGVA
ncbi:MAG: hypothetical protein VXZ82_02215 [Planctomycetota bacterium]|nr:hypothetical protein [Planctomycetota bacterium]